MTSLPTFTLSPRVSHELGFAEVERLMAARCVTPFGRDALSLDIFPSTTADLERRLDEVMEAAHLFTQRSFPDFAALRDIRPALDFVEMEAVLAPHDLIDIGRTVEACARLKDLIESRSDEVPRMWARIQALHDQRDWARRILRSFDEQGALTDDASPELRELRNRVRVLREKAQEQLEGLIRGLDDTDYLRDRNFTVRNDRYVLPVRAEYQGRVEGIVNDASQTGQTVYIEPREMLELGNRIKIARAAVQEEELRILAELTEQVRERRDEILNDLLLAGHIESVFARGAFAARTEARRVIVESIDDGRKAKMELRGARHPLLAYVAAEAREKHQRTDDIVPNDIGFGGRRALLITGPNAGGKTVALKTLGLCALLCRAGMPIPAHESSRIPLFSSVLSTIGDQQSLAEALSSFSGHLEALRDILASAAEQIVDGPVLCLLDELAAGTDPAQGAAVGQAVIEALVECGALTVVTTHFERLKLLALDEAEGNPYRNASLSLEVQTGRPTFALRLDQVGTSNALDAARRHGLPSSVIARAEALLAPEERSFQEVMVGLAAKHAELERRLEEVERERSRLESQRRKLSERLDEVEREAARLRRDGARAFEAELAEARKVVAEAIQRTMAGADARELNRTSHQLQEKQRRAQELVAAVPRGDDIPRGISDVKRGDLVEVVTLPGTPVEVVEINGDEVVVARGPMKLRTDRASLRLPKGARISGGSPAPQPMRRDLPVEQPSEPRTSDNTLDIRGERVDDALELLEAFLDRLLRENRTRAFVLHGHGTGALKRAVREALAQSRYVARAEAAHHDDGGDACTVVQLGDPRR
ncbi:MAG: endonuclease MutS2 [Myxococcota bacterium]